MDRSNMTFRTRVIKDFKLNRELYLIVFPVVLYYIIFYYKPMYGLIIAFKEFNPMKGIVGSPWVGLKNFFDFFNGIYFWRTLRNTVWISLNDLIIGFPIPIILALLINEVRNKAFKRTVQTISYMPYFISFVVVCGLIKEFTNDSGIINDLIVFLGGERSTLLNRPELFVTIYVISRIWQNAGWGSIIYIAALSSINDELYEAAHIDGAGRWKQTLHVTLPGIMPTIVILLILKIGQMMSLGHEKILLLYNPSIYETADVISTYVYRKGLLDFNWSFSAAVGLFDSLINVFLLVFANKLSRKLNDTSLW